MPAAVRKQLGIKPGNQLDVQVEGDQVVIRKAPQSYVKALEKVTAPLWKGYARELQGDRDQNGIRSLNRIPAGSRIALGTASFVYFLERHPTYYPTAKDLFERIEKGKIEAVASTLVLTELLVPAFRAEDSSRAQEVLRLLTHFPHLKLIEVTASIASEASRIRAESSLRTPDALHLATALMQKADWFVTNDKTFTRLPNLPLKISLFAAS